MSRGPILPFLFFLLVVPGNKYAVADNPPPATQLPALLAPQAPTQPSATLPPVNVVSESLREAMLLMRQGQWDEAMKEVTFVLQKDPRNFDAYVMRGNLYSRQKNWASAEADYQAARQIDPANVAVNFNFALIELLQKKYALARAGFVALQTDADWGDLASYEVFFCDLAGARGDAAAQELNAFNQVGSKASY